MKMTKKISTDTFNIAHLLKNITLCPYEQSSNVSDEQKWVILSSICRSLSLFMPKNLLVESNPVGSNFNFSDLAEMDEKMLTEIFLTPDTFYNIIREKIIDGFKEYVESKSVRDIYQIEDCN